MEHVRKKPCAADFIVIIATVLLTVVLILTGLRGDDGRYCLVSYDGGVMTLPLDRDDTVHVTSNGIDLTVEVSSGSVCVKDSGCPDGVCVETGKISREGQSVVCLPAKVTLTVLGEESGGADYVIG